jgi:hypothetical protein
MDAFCETFAIQFETLGLLTIARTGLFFRSGVGGLFLLEVEHLLDVIV